MFENLAKPNGRNSVQTLLYWPAQILRAYFFVVGVIVATPIITVFLGHEHYQAQKVVVEAYNATVPVDAVLVDFNRPSMDLMNGREDTFVDLEVSYRAWRAQTSEQDNTDPAFYLYYLPFTVIPLKDISADPLVKHVWVPNTPGKDMKSLGPIFGLNLSYARNAWVWAQLPWAPGAMRIAELERVGGAFGDQNPIGRRMDAVDRALSKGYSFPNDFCASTDAFVHNGLFKMAPTKWWDWYSGQEQLHAKASYNYRAYVAAARAVTALRYYVACRKAGIQVDPKKFSRSGVWMKPGLAPFDATNDEAKQFAFFRNYIKVFDGHLPRVMLHLQTLDDVTPLRDPKVWAFQTAGRSYTPASYDPNGNTQYVRGSDFNHEGFPTWPFATGMHLMEPGPLSYNANYGRPVFSRVDYWTSHTPAQNATAEEAQDRMLAMLTFKLWDPIMRLEGITDAEEDITIILADIKASLNRDIQFCTKWGHKVYHHKTNLGD